MEKTNMNSKRCADENKREFLDVDATKKAKFEDRVLRIVKQETSSPTGPVIGKVEKSSVLSRVRDFLPEISRANSELEKEISNGYHEKFDIENIEDSDKVIELSLSLVPENCGDGKLPSEIKDLLNDSGDCDSESSESSEDESEEEKKESLIEEINLRSGNG